MEADSEGLDRGRRAVEAWVDRYEAAWRSAGTGALAALFAEDAGYRMSPYEETAVGLGAIAGLWERERQGPDEEFEEWPFWPGQPIPGERGEGG